MTKLAGVWNATIHNCTIGNAVYIRESRNYIANYIIEEEAIIENVDMLALEEESSFWKRDGGSGCEGGGEQKNTESMMAYRLTRLNHRVHLEAE